MQIPFRHFVISTATGLQPTNIVFVQAGASLGSLHSWRDLYGPRSITLLTLCLLAALLPIFVRRHWLKGKPGECPLQPVSATPQFTLLLFAFSPDADTLMRRLPEVKWLVRICGLAMRRSAAQQSKLRQGGAAAYRGHQAVGG